MPKAPFVSGETAFQLLKSPELLKNSTHTVKGNRDGIIILPEISMPSAAPAADMSGSASISSISRKKQTVKIILGKADIPFIRNSP